MPSPVVPFLAVAVIWLSTCQDAPAPATKDRPSESRPAETLSLGAPQLVIGADTKDPGGLLYRVRGVFRTPDGRMVVGNSGTSEIRVFDATGSLATQMGSVGSGPKEFQSLQGVFPAGGDSLLAWDPLTQRISVWSLGGQLFQTIRVPIMFAPIVNGRTPSGRLVISVERRGRPDAVPGWQTYTDSLEVLLLDLEAMRAKRLGLFPDLTIVAAEVPGSGRHIGAPLAGQRGVIVRAFGERALVAIPKTGQVLAIDSTGDISARLNIDLPARRRTEAAVEEWLQRAVSRAEPSERPAIRAYYERFPQPSTYPILDNVLIDADGDLWVREFAPPGEQMTRLLHVSWEGKVISDILIPAAFQPAQIGDSWVLGILRGENDEEMVALYVLPTNS